MDVKYSYNNKKVRGINWYKITVPAGKIAVYKLEQTDPSGGSLGAAISIVNSNDSENVMAQGGEIQIENIEQVDKDYYFNLSIDDNALQTVGEFVVVYKLEFGRIN